MARPQDAGPTYNGAINDVRPDSMGGALLGHNLGKSDEAMLGRDIGRLEGRSFLGVH